MIRVQSALGLGSKTIRAEHTSTPQLSLMASAGGRPGPPGLRSQAQLHGLRNVEGSLDAKRGHRTSDHHTQALTCLLSAECKAAVR